MLHVTLHPTSTVIDLIVRGHVIQVRLWEGTSDNDTPVHAYIVRIACSSEDAATIHQFAQDLKAAAAPSPLLAGIPLRQIL